MLVCLFLGEIKIRITGTFNDVCVLIFVIVQQQFYLLIFLCIVLFGLLLFAGCVSDNPARH